RRARQLQATEPRRGVQPSIEQHPIDDEPHEQRLDHLQSGRQQGEYQKREGGVAIRPQPAQVLSYVRPSLAARWAPGVARLSRVVEAPVFVVLDEAAIALARRTGLAHRFAGASGPTARGGPM